MTNKIICPICNSKPIDYLKSNLQGEARRNIVNALEKLCFCKDSFHYAALTLARLALAENEEWANNSKGQFLQLFHVALSGMKLLYHISFRKAST